MCNSVASVQVVTFCLLVVVLYEDGYGVNADEWAGRGERQWKLRKAEGRKAKEEMGRKEELRVQLLRF